jgi:hypothetical protein
VATTVVEWPETPRVTRAQIRDPFDGEIISLVVESLTPLTM